MAKIYLIRHGQSIWNELGKIQGQTNIPLTSLGMRQAQAIGIRLSEESIDKIYTSDLQRAYNTAQIIGQKIKKSITPVKSLREIKLGPWEGLTEIEVSEKYCEEYDGWLRNPETMKLEGVESLSNLSNRAMSGINDILRENQDKNIVIVSHGITLKVLLLGLLNMPLSNLKNLTISNVGLNIVELRDYNNVLIKLNDTSHLKGLL